MKDYYKTLGVEKGASKDEIKTAFRKLAHQYHPDKTKNDPASSQKFKEAIICLRLKEGIPNQS